MVALVQRPAPTFVAKVVNDGLITDISLTDYRGQWVVLLFYPMDFTFVCPTEILAFNDALLTFKALNTAVFGVSTDSEYSHFAWATQPRKEGGLGPDLKLPLITDKNMNISREYGVLLEDQGVALRGLFLIDPKGILRQITVNDLPVGRSVEETIRLIKAFQFTDEHGEVCPANWTEGSKTMKPDPKGSLEYFEAVAANGVAVNGNGSEKKRPRVV
ncbi:Peroxiredoxin [Termitomyces sp. T112]|nr:hypothetical protein C0989_012687 [Termitomyces sp. Mn162]KAG5735442.1 Peroxiredoxin [Termitomyces sp. T112]KAH0580437.1 hypothetical protein H2248_001938 [Termitomyces sp. 'cryptogamus']KNZ82361.1 Peroxiredoxin [Termitomyces sp. J132]